MPFSRRYFTALSKSPPDSSRARLQSMTPAFVCSRRRFTSSAVATCACPSFSGLWGGFFGCRLRPRIVRRSRERAAGGQRLHVESLGVIRLGSVALEVAAFEGGVGDLASDQLDGADGVVVRGDRVVDLVGIAVGVAHGNDRDARA